jgi:hypothetical protein
VELLKDGGCCDRVVVGFGFSGKDNVGGVLRGVLYKGGFERGGRGERGDGMGCINLYFYECKYGSEGGEDEWKRDR